MPWTAPRRCPPSYGMRGECSATSAPPHGPALSPLTRSSAPPWPGCACQSTGGSCYRPSSAVRARSTSRWRSPGAQGPAKGPWLTNPPPSSADEPSQSSIPPGKRPPGAAKASSSRSSTSSPTPTATRRIHRRFGSSPAGRCCCESTKASFSAPWVSDPGKPQTRYCSRSVASRDRRHHAAALGHAAEVGWIHDGDGQVRPGESRPA